MIREIPNSQIDTLQGQTFQNVMGTGAGILIREFWSPDETTNMAEGVLSHRKEWHFFPDFYNYYSLGCPLYAFRCDDKQDEYFDEVKKFDLLLSQLFPDLLPKITGMFKKIQHPDECQKKKYYGGLGMVIHNDKSKHDAHFDQDESVLISKARFPNEKVIYTFVGMIKSPDQGGRLMVWDKEPSAKDTEKSLEEFTQSHSPDLVDYRVGDLLILDGAKLHKIEECKGERITVALHFLKSPHGEWQYWF